MNRLIASRKKTKPVFLLGDWNVTFMSHSNQQATGEFLVPFYSILNVLSFNYAPHQKNKAHMSSLIYNVFTNDPLDHSTSGLFLKDTSDHLPQYFPLFQDISRMLNRISIFYFVIKTPKTSKNSN